MVARKDIVDKVIDSWSECDKMRVVNAITRVVNMVSSSIAVKYYDRLLNQAFIRRIPVAPISESRKEVGRRS